MTAGPSPNVLFNLGDACYRRGRDAEALAAFLWALQLAPGDEDCRENLPNGFALEDAFSGQHLEEHAPECPDICAAVDALAESLFRRHICSRSENHAWCCGGRQCGGV